MTHIWIRNLTTTVVTAAIISLSVLCTCGLTAAYGANTDTDAEADAGMSLKDQIASLKDNQVMILRSSSSARKIPELRWDQQIVEVQMPPQDQKKTQKPWIALDGVYPKDDWQLLWKTKSLIPRSKTGKFRVQVPLSGKVLNVQFTAIGPRGKPQKEIIRIIYPGWDHYLAELDGAKKPSVKKTRGPWLYSPSMGFSLISYKQAGSPDVSEAAITGKMGVVYLLPSPNWSLGANLFVTLLPVSVNAEAKSAARFLGTNFRVGYNIPNIPSPWHVSLMLGVYYTTMLVPENAYGYEHMTGPQVFAVVRRTLNQGNSIGSYLKLAPIAQSFSLLALDNRELAAGLNWTHLLENDRSISFAVDAAKLDLMLGNFTIESNSVSFSVGYGF